MVSTLHRPVLEMSSSAGQKRACPASYSQPLHPQHQQYKLPAYLLPNNHDSNIDFYDPIHPTPGDQMPPSRPLSMGHNVHTAPVPIHGFTTTNSTHSKNCSSCCDDDNFIDKCENANCTDGCDNCIANVCHTGVAPCNLDDCKVAAACPISPCSPVPVACTQAASIACQTIICEDEVCPVETGACAVECVEAIFCHEESCQDECPLPCEEDCSEVVCRDHVCQVAAASAYCPPPSCHAQNGVSFHVNNANSSRWQKPHSRHTESTHYASVSPGSLTLNTNYFPQFNSLLNNSIYGDFGIPADMEMSFYPSTKRRRISDVNAIPTPAFDHNYPTAPSSTAPTPVSSDFGDIFCLWDDNCEETFFDNLALQDHIQNTHIDVRADNRKCLWDGCGQESTDPNSLFDHIKISHAPPLGEHICMWAGCNAILNSEEELQSHINTHLPSSNQCKWDACDLLTPTVVDLEKHVQSHHLVSQKSLDCSSATSGVKTCEWQDMDVQGNFHICGCVFQSSTELQQHAKDIHITALRKKTGYHCLWVGCNRRDKPFSQKGKVERHLQTHTGFKSCTCQVCGKEFSAPQALQQHIRTHTGEKPYKCDICGKEFAQGSAMTMHKRVHTGERPLMCDFPGCGKRFSESSNLSKHRKTHNPVGQHCCSFPGCDRSFHRLDQMKRHQKIHGVDISASMDSS